MSGTFLEELVPEVVVLDAKPRLEIPRKYKVLLLNDDYTPMDFVVMVLKSLFRLDEATATHIMLQVHTQGRGVCGVFTRDIAETKVAQVLTCAKQHEHPLLCTMEPE